MKTPEEIKKGLFCCWEDGCTTCPYDDDCTMGENFMDVARDALTYIQQLESRLAQAERERDAAVRDCARFPCYTCNEKGNGDFCHQCRTTGTFRSLHEWRGVCEENTVDGAE